MQVASPQAGEGGGGKGGKWYDGARVPAKASSGGAILPQERARKAWARGLGSSYIPQYDAAGEVLNNSNTVTVQGRHPGSCRAGREAVRQ